MADISTIWDSQNLRGDWVQSGASLQAADDVVTALLISLFTDRVANDDDAIPDGTTDPRGWWADDAQHPIGSRLWLLGREKQLDSVPQRAHDYCAEALQWMIDDGIVTKFDISAEWVRPSVLGVEVTAYQRTGATIQLTLQANRTAAGFSFAIPAAAARAAPAPTFSSAPGVAPAPAPSSAIAIGDWPNVILQAGDSSSVAYWGFENVWGAVGLTRGIYAGINGTTWEQKFGIAQPATPGGTVGMRVAWKFPTGQTEVKSYPMVEAGYMPGWSSTWVNPGGYSIQLPDGSISQSYPSGGTPNSIFPQSLPLTSLKSTFAYTHNETPTGRGHLTYDIWLQNSPTQSHGFTAPPITTEIMIPLNFWSGYPAYGQYVAAGGGRSPSWYWGDETIDGILWHIFQTATATRKDGSAKSNYFNGEWVLIVFEPDGPVPNRQIDLAALINYAVTKGWTDASVSPHGVAATHVVSVQLGVEAVDGTGDLELTNFGVTP